MKHIALLSTLSLALLASFAAQAADTTELKVTGTIKPGACAPALTGGGTADYGNILRSSLSATAMTLLAEKTIPFSLTCDAATKMAITLMDNKRGSVVAGAGLKINSARGGLADAWVYGLGTFDGKKLGAYAVKIASVTGDGASVADLYRIFKDGTSGSTASNNANGYYILGDMDTWRAGSTAAPNGYKVLAGNLIVQAVLESATNLPAGDVVPLDGSSTLEIIYL